MNTPVKPTALPPDHPIFSRQTLQRLQNVEGEIVQLDPVNFGIQTASLSSLLLPLNLPEDFQTEGLKISFSGNLKEIGLNEFMAGHPLELTEILKK
jgi:hypothetical protein